MHPIFKEGLITVTIILGAVFIADMISRSPIPSDLRFYVTIIASMTFVYTAIYFVKKNIHRL